MIVLLFSLFIHMCLAEETIKYAAIVYRHGDRCPVNMYPTDPFKNESLWPEKFGELTIIGKKQHYVYGQYLRKRYGHFLSNGFDPTEIYVRSSDYDRTLMSATCNLAGMYPPVGKDVWNDHLNWQPAPVHTVKQSDDEIVALSKECTAYDKEMDRYSNSKDFKIGLSKYQPLMDYMTAYTGKKIKSYNDINDVYNVLMIETFYNFTLPNWTHAVFPDKMREPACYSFKTIAGTPLLARLKAGPLLQEITKNMKKAATAKDNKFVKLHVYSGHDMTVGALLSALGLFDGQCPVYTSTIFFELIYNNSTSKQFIRISYKNSVDVVEPEVMKIPYCEKKCPLERFAKIYENLLTVNFDRECGKRQFPALLGISFLAGLMIFATIYVAHKIHFNRVAKQQRLKAEYSSIHLFVSRQGHVTSL